MTVVMVTKGPLDTSSFQSILDSVALVILDPFVAIGFQEHSICGQLVLHYRVKELRFRLIQKDMLRGATIGARIAALLSA